MAELLNLFLHDTISENPYKARSTPITHKYPIREDPVQHGNRLINEYALAKKASDRAYSAEQIAAIKAKEGHYYDISGLRGKELVVQSLEAVNSNIRVCNVRVNEADGDEEITATVYIPNSKEHIFLRKIQEYAKGIPEGKNKPVNDELVKSIESINASVTRSLWTDDLELFPIEAKWCEIWLRIQKDNAVSIKEEFFQICSSLKIEYSQDTLLFPDRMVCLVFASERELQALLLNCSFLAEFRSVADTCSFFATLTPKEQKEWSDDLLSRLKIVQNNTSVCVLDTGVNNEHPLLSQFYDTSSIHKARDYMYSAADMNGHGTQMAGITGYGDLLDSLSKNDPITVHHCLESVKLLGSRPNEPYLYGDYTKRAVAMAEYAHPERNRALCLAITADSTAKEKDGRPSSWSAALDAIASGVDDETRRLILVSAGNVQLSEYNEDGLSYPEANITHGVEDPAQAWNVLTVGASTYLDTIDCPDHKGCQPVAPAGMLSPFSATSRVWSSRWPIKPEILCEGGNAAIDNHGVVDTCDSLSVLTTHYHPTERLFTTTNATSAAVAKASWIAAEIMSMYPACWPETVRALMVASARWPESMFKAFCGDAKKKGEVQKLLRTCGYGIVDLDRARYCAENAVNMIIEGEIQPFEKRNGSCGYAKMHLHELPWPRELLLSMGAETVEMKVVLSYFIEPGPGEIGFNDRYRYPSCGLRFDVNNKGESKEQFERRVNQQMKEDKPNHSIDTVTNDSGRWLVGIKGRNAGSLHCDIWKGTAADLSESNLIAVYPNTGWWRTRSYLNKQDSKVRYSLVVTLSTPSIETKLYTAITNSIGIPVEVKQKNVPSRYKWVTKQGLPDVKRSELATQRIQNFKEELDA